MVWLFTYLEMKGVIDMLEAGWQSQRYYHSPNEGYLGFYKSWLFKLWRLQGNIRGA